MNDLISRSALIMRLNDYALQVAPFRDMKSTWQYDAVQECIKAVEEQLTVEPAADVPDINVGNKWIPCSERLPEEHQTVITTHEDGTVVFHRYIKEHGFIYNWETDMELRKKRGKVVAWMPLPEPWKGKV